MTQQEINNIIQDYSNGMCIDNVCKKYHHRYNIIIKILKENNIHIRKMGEYWRGRERVFIDKEIEDKIVEEYLSGKGLAASGKKYNVTQFKVRKILEKRGIKIRSFSESASISNTLRKKYFCNVDYFKNENENMAYILGFLAADGTIRLKSNDLKITLSRKDKELLEKIKKELEYTGEIKDATTNSGFDITTLQITCKEYKQDLAKYNIVPQKTNTYTFPENLNKKYWIDFIRGYWDGDGTICTAGKEAIRSSLCGNKKEFLEFVVNFLEEEYNIPKVNIQKVKNSNTYYFQYSNNSTIKLFHALYYKKDLLCLDRKREKFELLCADDNLSTRQRLSMLRE